MTLKGQKQKQSEVFFCLFWQKVFLLLQFFLPLINILDFLDFEKNFGPLLAKFLASTFLEGSKNLAYSFSCYF